MNRPLLIICLLLCILVSIVNARTYQKYYEPFVVFTIAYIICTMKSVDKVYYWTGLLALLFAFAVISVFVFFL